MDELCKKSATELAHLIKNKEASSAEIISAHLQRVEEVNPDINAITTVLEDSSRKAAQTADSASKEDRQRPLHGVPFTIKEKYRFSWNSHNSWTSNVS